MKDQIKANLTPRGHEGQPEFGNGGKVMFFPPPPRVVQIAVMPDSEAMFPVLFILKGDGTVWHKAMREGADWHQEHTP